MHCRGQANTQCEWVHWSIVVYYYGLLLDMWIRNFVQNRNNNLHGGALIDQCTHSHWVFACPLQCTCTWEPYSLVIKNRRWNFYGSNDSYLVIINEEKKRKKEIKLPFLIVKLTLHFLSLFGSHFGPLVPKYDNALGCHPYHKPTCIHKLLSIGYPRGTPSSG